MSTLFPGISNLAVIHPMVVHLPIAYLLTAFLFELIRYFTNNERVKVFAEWMVYLGAASAIAAVGAGFLAAESLGHDSPGHDLVHIHRDIMVSMTVGFVLLALALALIKQFRDGPFRKGLVVLLTLLTGLMAFGADKGGQLVYQHGTGVNPAILKSQDTPENQATHGHADEGPVANHHENPEQKMRGQMPTPDEHKVDDHHADDHTH